jgi:hypothetical protein
MTPMKWAAGCVVILAVLLGGIVSSKIVNGDFPTGVRPENQDQIALRGHCVSLGGKQFEWPWANVPFAAMSCSN